MAQYCTIDDFRDLSLPPDALTGLDDGQINKALIAASSEADGYISKRFKLPLVGSTGAALSLHVANIAAYYLMGRRGFRPASGNNEMIVYRYEQALKWLGLVADGDVEPGFTDSTPDLDEDGPLAASTGGTPNQWNIQTGRGRCTVTGLYVGGCGCGRCY